MEKEVRDSFERIEKRLNAIEDLGKVLKTTIEQLSNDLTDGIMARRQS